MGGFQVKRFFVLVIVGVVVLKIVGKITRGEDLLSKIRKAGF